MIATALDRERRPRSAGRLAPLSILLVVLLSGVPSPSLANGWEHLAIPYPALLEGLENGQVETRRRAAHSLGARQERRGVGPLVAALERPEPDAGVRAEIHVALGRVRDASTVPLAIGCLAEEPKPVVRAACAVALGLHGAQQGLPALVAALERDGEADLVRARAIESLGRFRDPRAVAALHAALGRADNLIRRRRIVGALGETREPTAAPVLLAVFEAAARPADRLLAARALALIGSPEATPTLVAALETEVDPAIRAALVVAIGAGAGESAYDALIARLADPSLPVRHFAVHGLGTLGRPEAAPAIARLGDELAGWLEASNPALLVADLERTLDRLSLLQSVFRVVVELDAAPATGALSVAAIRRPMPIRSAAEAKVAEALYETRRLALYGLGYTASDGALELLSGASGIGDRDPRLRATATRSLGVLSVPVSAARVLPLLGDPVAEVRWTAAMVLGRLPDSAPGPALLEVLADPSAEVRRQSALSLGYLGWAPARSRVEDLAGSDPDPRVREAAAFAASLLEG